MKTLLKIIGYTFLAFVAIGLLGSLLGGAPESQSTEEEESASAKYDLSEADIRKLLEQDKAYLVDAKKNFTYTEDEFTGAGWYEHKLWKLDKILHKNLLTANVHSSGRAYLSSHYYGSDWIFHESITAKIDERVITSEVVSMHDKGNIQENYGGSVWETIHFTADRDNGILAAVGANPERKIRVRFNGRTFNKDITLSKNDKQALADCSFLSQLLRSVAEKEAQLKTLAAE